MTTRTAVMSRRTVLAAAVGLPAVGVLAACGSDGAAGNPDDGVKAAVAASEQQLLGLYDAAISKFPSLAGTLTPIRAQHSEHLAAVVGDTTAPGESAVLSATSASAALTELASAERRAAKARIASCGQCSASELAWLLSLIGASESQHAATLAGAST